MLSQNVDIQYQVIKNTVSERSKISTDLGKVVLYIGEHDRLVPYDRFSEFMKGTEKAERCWGIATPVSYALKHGMMFNIVYIVNCHE